eukprot:TRINITY_DN5863_c0_g1_i1.p1 TRINITY_DN5863_c0_g1~~TRINITY_DN5863_c0_g1_i1.p1  ORF type:complete len:363 (+),score=66.34 TRINITY_DN5863_c0_g1_i1:68-1156(+)
MNPEGFTTLTIREEDEKSEGAGHFHLFYLDIVRVVFGFLLYERENTELGYDDLPLEDWQPRRVCYEWKRLRSVSRGWKQIADETMRFNRSEFLYFVDNNHLEMVKFLINRREIDPGMHRSHQHASYHYFPISSAVNCESLGIVSLLLKDSRVDPSVEDQNPIRTAVANGNEEIFNLLMKDPRTDPKTAIDYISGEKTGVNIVRTLLSDPRIDPILLRDNALPNSIYRQDSCIDFETVSLLLHDPRVSWASQDNAAIIKAASSGCPQLVATLLGNPEVDPGAQNNEALIEACSVGDVEIITMLLERKEVSVSERALRKACRHGHLSAISLLLTVMDTSEMNDQLCQESFYAFQIHSLSLHLRM